MRAMEQAGLEVLSANQTRACWSTYHGKNKNSTASVLVSLYCQPQFQSATVPSSFVSSDHVPPASVPSATVPPVRVS